MKTKYLIGAALIVAVIVLIGLVTSSSRQTLKDLFNPQPALALEDQEHYVYIPMIANYYPVATSFGTEMEQADRLRGFGLVNQTNSSWIRQNALVWSFVEPTKGARNWDTMADLDEAIIEATKKNIGTVMIVRNTPTWAQSLPGIYCGPIKPEELQAFGQFMYDAVSRYSKPPYNVKVWEVWNEPDVPPTPGAENRVWGCWGDLNDPYYGGGYFAEMLKAVYPQMKAADPEAQVFIGGLLLDCDPRPQSNYCAYYNKDERPPKFLEGILLNGGANYFDGVAFHGYDYFNQMNPSLGFYVNLAWAPVGIPPVLSLYPKPPMSATFWINIRLPARC
jgi:hypothetical protein